MSSFFKYFGAFCLLTIAASLAFCSVGLYQGVKTANRYLAGADNYTCRQFLYDLEHPETDKFAPMVIATIAYGTGPEGKMTDEKEQELSEQGMSPAVRKVYTLCKQKPAERVLNVFAAEVTGATTPVSSTMVSPTAPLAK